jgi:hypothetical protein
MEGRLCQGLALSVTFAHPQSIHGLTLYGDLIPIPSFAFMVTCVDNSRGPLSWALRSSIVTSIRKTKTVTGPTPDYSTQCLSHGRHAAGIL